MQRGGRRFREVDERHPRRPTKRELEARAANHAHYVIGGGRVLRRVTVITGDTGATTAPFSVCTRCYILIVIYCCIESPFFLITGTVVVI